MRITAASLEKPCPCVNWTTLNTFWFWLFLLQLLQIRFQILWTPDSSVRNDAEASFSLAVKPVLLPQKPKDAVDDDFKNPPSK